MKGCACCVLVLVLISLAYADDGIQGKITAIDATGGTIEVSGVKVIAKRAVIENLADMKCTLADLKVGDSVDVDGTLTGAGEMTAREIDQEHAVVDQIEGRLASRDNAARTLTVSGVTVKVPATALVEDTHDRPITLEGLTPGSRIDCEGTWTGPRELTATRVEAD
ncbi:MAG: DUF5666 domain-containing protein [Candidatus Aureabacteria bacterium]|nr:DUF5666 domain-containing protein [Candidatus Auribacterota bacterium]